MNGPASDGISAIPPLEYADRFQTFLDAEVLQLRNTDGCTPPTPEVESHTCFKRCCPSTFGPRESGWLRWGKLWRHRRIGLIRECIETERTDYLIRIRDLENQLEEARSTSPRGAATTA